MGTFRIEHCAPCNEFSYGHYTVNRHTASGLLDKEIATFCYAVLGISSPTALDVYMDKQTALAHAQTLANALNEAKDAAA